VSTIYGAPFLPAIRPLPRRRRLDGLGTAHAGRQWTAAVRCIRPARMHAPDRRVTPDQLAERIIDSLRELDRRDLTVMASVLGDPIRAARCDRQSTQERGLRPLRLPSVEIDTMISEIGFPSSAYHQRFLPGIMTMYGRYPTPCELTTPSSSPGTIWCPKCDCRAPITARTFRSS
jgi:hypothetical protein